MVGTIPLTIQLPERAPISNKIIMAVATPRILLQIAFSMTSHFTLQKSMANIDVMAVEVNNTIWLPPDKASPPKVRMVKYKSITKVRIGTAESNGEGSFLEFLFIIFDSLIGLILYYYTNFV